MRSDTLRGEVRSRWKWARRPCWDYKATRSVCVKVDSYFAGLGENPTPRFREEIREKNEPYISSWVWGCHFEWLNPRKRWNNRRSLSKCFGSSVPIMPCASLQR